jgi:hypothetical protein
MRLTIILSIERRKISQFESVVAVGTSKATLSFQSKEDRD